MKFFAPILVVFVVVSLLVWSAVNESSKKILTVESLLADGDTQKRIRVGARVSSREISVSAKNKQVSFTVTDPKNKSQVPNEDVKSMKVIYHGLVPDTLKLDRDVIMEGDYIVNEGESVGVFSAHTLNTQCPSKYEPPKPGQEKKY